MPRIKKGSELPELTTIASADFVIVIDDTGTITKKITVDNLVGGLIDLTAAEIQQLQNIDATTISSTQWGYLGGFDQDLQTTSAVTFATVDTGQGANELYAMDQDVQSSDSPTFVDVTLTENANMILMQQVFN